VYYETPVFEMKVGKEGYSQVVERLLKNILSFEMCELTFNNKKISV